MAWYVITYDLTKKRNYDGLYEVLKELRAAPLVESVWLAELRGPAQTVRDLLMAPLDDDDSVAVLELQRGFDWATVRAFRAGNEWLRARAP